jgi:hypothetical protein
LYLINSFASGSYLSSIVPTWINKKAENMQKFLLSIFLFVFASLSAFAQANASTGQVTGVVKDPNQSVLTGTQVVLNNPRTETKITAITNSQGVYEFPALQPGTYVVEVNAKGFKPSVSPELSVMAGRLSPPILLWCWLAPRRPSMSRPARSKTPIEWTR